jgi:hypothetical protein
LLPAGGVGGVKFVRPYLEKTYHKNGLVEWLKVYTLSSNPSIPKINLN